MKTLLSTTKENIAPLHRYNRDSKRKIRLDELRQYDLSVPLVSGVKPVIPYDEAFEIMLEALAPLGEDYIDTL